MQDNIRVLVIEDDADLRDLMMTHLKEKGLVVDGLDNGTQAVATVEAFKPDIVLLDQNLPGMSGGDIVRQIRKHEVYFSLPIMMVTGQAGEQEKVAALELGADDYLVKPFSSKELIARIQALHRRAHVNGKDRIIFLEYKDIKIDLKSHKVFLKETEVALTLTEFKILSELLRQSGEVLTRDKLRERALGNLHVTDRTIDVHMASLRKKLEHMGENVETVRGVGYRLAQ